jgi:hypothetical protein
VQQHNVDPVGGELVTEPLERRPAGARAGSLAGRGGVFRPVVTPPDLGENLHLVAGNRSQRLAEIDVRAVQVGQVEEAQPPVVAVAEERDELVEAQPGLVRLPVAAVDAGPLREPCQLDTGVAERHERRRGHFARDCCN